MSKIAALEKELENELIKDSSEAYFAAIEDSYVKALKQYNEHHDNKKTLTYSLCNTLVKSEGFKNRCSPDILLNSVNLILIAICSFISLKNFFILKHLKKDVEKMKKDDERYIMIERNKFIFSLDEERSGKSKKS